MQKYFRFMPVALNLLCAATVLAQWQQAFSQTLVQSKQSDQFTPGQTSPPDFFRKQFTTRIPPPYAPKKPFGKFGIADWRRAIDSTWGQGLPTQQKLQIFDRYWRVIDSSFACFSNLPINWDSLQILYRAEIQNGVSRGRFEGILDHLSISLKEAHTAAYDIPVVSTTLNPGVPLLVVGGWGSNGHFGAGLTPLPDSSLLVYSVVANHPLGLQRGDIVLGYNRVAWKNLSRTLLQAQLPITGWWWGCSPSAYTHSILMSAGMNWHLFDTIDVVKYSSGDTVHLSTSPLAGQNMSLFATEQMDIPGVPKPNYGAQQLFTSGIINGTNIGYIYGWGWFWNAETEFQNAVQALAQTDALIIDFRMNYGGNMFLSNAGLGRLFPSSVSTIDFAGRCSPSIHNQMCPFNISNTYIIPGGSPGYTRPIAVLVGPGAVSSGDQVALRMKYHPYARFFGKSTTAAFNAPSTVDLGNPDFYFRYARVDAYQLSGPDVYLTHEELPVDEEVWLTTSSVAQGKDNVVDAALRWIESVVTSKDENPTLTPNAFELFQNYPNPFNPTTEIKFSVAENGRATLEVFNILGQKVATLFDDVAEAGRYYNVKFNAVNLASGVYLYRLESGQQSEARRLVLLR